MEVILVSRSSDPEFNVSSILNRATLPLKEKVHYLGMLLKPVLLLDKLWQLWPRAPFTTFG